MNVLFLRLFGCKEMLIVERCDWNLVKLWHAKNIALGIELVSQLLRL